MNSHYPLAVHGLKVGDGDLPVKNFARRHWRGHVWISRKFGNVAGVFVVRDSVDRVDAQNRSWRDLCQSWLRERRSAESGGQSCFPKP